MKLPRLILKGLLLTAVAVACGGQSGKPAAGNAGNAGVAAQATGASGGAISVAGAEPGGGGGAAGSAGVAGSDADAGEMPESCSPGTAAVCEGNLLVTCSAAGVVERLGCGDDAFCDTHGEVAECREADASLGTEVNEYGFALRDVFMLQPCFQKQGFRCLTVLGGCPGQGEPSFEDKGYVLAQHFLVGGELGKLYTAHIAVNGIVEAKYYEKGERDGGADFSDPDRTAGTDTFYRGGNPIPSNYNSLRLTVFKPDSQPLQHYYLNAFPQESGFESHRTFPIGYEKDIELVGGGYVELRSQDANCDAVDNCGPGVNDVDCPAPRLVPSEPDLVLPTQWQGSDVETFNPITGASQPFHSQIVHITVSNIR